MSIIKLGNLDDIQEAILPPEGAYWLAVVKADAKEKDGKLSTVQIILSVEDEEQEYANLFSHMSVPREGDDEEMVKMKQLFIKRTLFWLGMHDAIADGTLEPQDLVGQRSTVQIPVSPSEYDGKPTRNVNWPSLPDEVEAA